jgi:hypothetical protein
VILKLQHAYLRESVANFRVWVQPVRHGGLLQQNTTLAHDEHSSNTSISFAPPLHPAQASIHVPPPQSVSLRRASLNLNLCLFLRAHCLRSLERLKICGNALSLPPTLSRSPWGPVVLFNIHLRHALRHSLHGLLPVQGVGRRKKSRVDLPKTDDTQYY